MNSKDYSTNLHNKLQNPPSLKYGKCLCLWSDLLGFSRPFVDGNWDLTDDARRQIYERLNSAHSLCMRHISHDERALILNDGLARVYHPRAGSEGNLFRISWFLRDCILMHAMINRQEREHVPSLPGCRSVLAFGENIVYLTDEVRYDDYVFNYTKPEGSDMSTIAKENGNPIVVYNPFELQMNTAFSKAYILEQGGSRAGLPGSNFYVDESVIKVLMEYAGNEHYDFIWKEENDEIQFLVPVPGEKDRVIFGFVFDKGTVPPYEMVRYSTKVYRVKKFFPIDELMSEFCFEL